MIRHYLDHNATAPVRPEVIDAVAQAMSLGGNPLSVHDEGRKARKLLEDAREAVRALVNAPVGGVIFTSGGTEAIHYGLHGVIGPHQVKRIFISAIEHSAVSANAAMTGAEVEIIPVDATGRIDLGWLGERLKTYDIARDGAFLACVMLANNETGVIQPIRDIADRVHDAGGLLFVDAAQAAGKIPVNFVMLGADLMSITAHKFGGPIGAGALIAGPNLPLEPVFRGGGQEENRRAGTHNLPAIAGFGVAARFASQGLARAAEIAAMRDRIETAVAGAGAHIWGAAQHRLPGTLCFSAQGFSAETQLMTMDLEGIAISAGSACSSGKTAPSHVLTAMGASPDAAKSSVRVSLGWNSNEADTEAFIKAWPQAYARIREHAA